MVGIDIVDGDLLSDRDTDYIKSVLKPHIKKWDLCIDAVLVPDLKVFGDHDKFFLFTEEVAKVLKWLMRDPWIAENIKVSSISSSPHVLQDKPSEPIIGIHHDNNKQVGMIPPSGLIPFKGMSFLIGVVCYLTDKVDEIYFLFRNMWCKYFCHLHSISSQDDSIVTMCKTFEDLL